MEPAILQDDILIISQCTRIAIGEIIAFHYGDEIITHRVIKIKPQLVTRGDNRLRDDVPISKDAVIGVVKTGLRKHKSYLNTITFKKKKGIIVFLTGILNSVILKIEEYV